MPFTVTVAPDRSLTTEEYIKLGVPATDRLWSSHDLGTAVEALKSLADTPEKLPRYQSKKSGEVFAKLVDEELSASFTDKNYPLETRMGNAVSGILHAKGLLSLYGMATRQDRIFDAELVSVQVFMLRYAADMMDAAKEFMATIQPTDPTYQNRVNGLAQVRSGIATMVAGALQTLTEKHVYRLPELVRLAREIKPILPRLVPELTPQSKAEVPVKLRQLIADETDPELKKTLSALLDRLEKT